MWVECSIGWTVNLVVIDLGELALCLGSSVFGWTIDESVSHEVLDAFRGHGGSFIDTADSYSVWAEGNVGGVSESIIGNWVADRGIRSEITLATKIGQMPDFEGYSVGHVRDSLDASLDRLRTDYVDVYYAHRDDQTVPLEEAAISFDAMVREGKVREVGLSNFPAARVRRWLSYADDNGLARPSVIQPHYNLMVRDVYESGLDDIAVEEKLSVVPYAGLARGFLTGRYREGAAIPDTSLRSHQATGYFGERGTRVLDTIEDIARRRGCAMATVALAWILAKPAVLSPIASASRPDQLIDLVAATHLRLSQVEIDALDEASAP